MSFKKYYIIGRASTVEFDVNRDQYARNGGRVQSEHNKYTYDEALQICSERATADRQPWVIYAAVTVVAPKHDVVVTATED